MKAYYDARADEYDDWWHGSNHPDDADWFEERDAICELLPALPAARTLDVACGTGLLTRLLPGVVTGLDQSARMLELARRRHGLDVVRGDALSLPFDDGSLERVFTSHFYGHLEEDDRLRFLAEARRVAPELFGGGEILFHGRWFVAVRSTA